MRVYKLQLLPVDIQIVSVPLKSTLLSVQLQREIPTMWYLCDPDGEENQQRKGVTIYSYPTGRMFECAGRFLGTVQLKNGDVYHFFEDENDPIHS